MAELIELLRAKSRKDEETNNESLLLRDHILETLKQLNSLYEYVSSNQDSIEYESLKDENKRNKLFAALAKALFIHDLGKIDYTFQEKLYQDDRNRLNELRNILKELKDKTKNIRHEILSIVWTIVLLNKEGEWEGKIRTSILFHHYNEFYTNTDREFLEIITSYESQIKEYLEFIKNNKERVKELLNALIKHIKNSLNSKFINDSMDDLQKTLNIEEAEELLYKIEKHEDDIYFEFYNPDSQNESKNQEENLFFILMSGVLRRCDHTGSAHIPIESEQNMLNLYDQINQNIGESLKNVPDDKFWQKQIVSGKILKNALLVAPTGSGKTEFAFLWADKLKRKMIYTLPLRVALNDLYQNRFVKYAGDKKVSLLHSTSFIEYLEEEKEGKSITIEHKVNSAKEFSSPLVLTTPDQVLLTSLNFYGSDKLLSIYPLSSIVLDEIQAYNPEMAAVIIKTIDIIQKMGGNLLIMTATYPPYYKKFFNGNSEIIKLTKFEKISIEECKENVKNYSTKRHKIELKDFAFFKEENEEISSEFKELLDKYANLFLDKNILIICNVVKKSIDIFDYLEKNKFPKNRLFLLHSRIIEIEKQKRVNNIKKILKEQNKEEKEGIILVSTQMIEASVDVDFDVIITEVSPIDSQVQRWGRVHRNRDNRNYQENEPNVIIFAKDDKYTNRIYDKEAVEKTKQILKESNNKLLEYKDECKLVEDIFSNDLLNKYETEIEKTITSLQHFSLEKRSEAQRLFRKIAGISFVFPDLMESYQDEIDKDLRKFFADIVESYENRESSWKDIIIKLKEKGVSTDKWKLRALLQEFSINIPIYYVDKQREKGKFILNHEFKGFYVFSRLKKDKVNEVIEKGIDIKEEIDKILLDEENFI